VASALGCTGTAGIPGSPRTSLGDQRTGHRHDPGRSMARASDPPLRARCPTRASSARSGRPHRRLGLTDRSEELQLPDVLHGLEGRAGGCHRAGVGNGVGEPSARTAHRSASRSAPPGGQWISISLAVGAGVQHHPAQQLREHLVDQLHRHRRIMPWDVSREAPGQRQCATFRAPTGAVAPGGIDGSLSRGWCRHRRCFPLHPPRSRTWPSPARRDDLRTGRHPQTAKHEGLQRRLEPADNGSRMCRSKFEGVDLKITKQVRLPPSTSPY
jgi:hypothetical protein